MYLVNAYVEAVLERAIVDKVFPIGSSGGGCGGGTLSWGELGSELRGLDSSEERQSLLESVAMEEEVDIFRVANGYSAQFLSGFLRVFGWAA
ncbi:hypothetical protein Pyn_04515 [Prunus yedoensis var. nudiflora]|uniref:Uncharacterized protein n=1 Tax=Prunus yedoensis var. nudiflora TaxID=2094558 RepID=A0A314XF96_PRUYE|nr:hypothetical protein Pyn_04515 [Prunus yedoensis var. nudiflora]